MAKLSIRAKLAEKEEGLPDTIHGLYTSRIRAILEQSGYQCIVKGSLRGSSGAIHEFDFVGKRDGERLVVVGFELYDLDSDEVEMVKLRVKTLDSCPNVAAVIFHSASPESIRQIAKDYKYTLIEPSGSKTVYQKFEDFLNEGKIMPG